MLKIAVFGVGRGGEAVARYLTTELATVEIVEVIDWSNPSGAYVDQKEMYQAAYYFLSPYIGKVDLVILADYTLSLVINSLRAQWLEQKIIGMEVDFRHIPKTCQGANVVTLLANELLFQSKLGEQTCRQLSYADVILPDCSGWERLIDTGDMSKDILMLDLGESFPLVCDYDPGLHLTGKKLRKERDARTEILNFLARANSVLQPSFAMAYSGQVNEHIVYYDRYGNLSETVELQGDDELSATDVVCLLSPHFWTIKQDLQELFGCNVTVVDFRKKLLHDVCLTLKLRGVDGRLGE